MAMRKKLTHTVTIYPRHTNMLTGQVKPMRRVLYRCRGDDYIISTSITTGQLTQTPTTITIWQKTSGLQYIKPHEWLLLPSDEIAPYWTVEASQTTGTVVVPWESDFEFSWGTASAATSAENAFVRDNPGAIRIQHTENNQITGYEKGAHVLISGK